MIATYHSTKLFDFANPEEHEYTIVEIAHSLGHLCRFVGFCSQFYSVAEHSILVSRAVPQEGLFPLWGLLHDAHEAYIGDLSSPLKVFLQSKKLCELEVRIQAAIYTGLDISRPDYSEKRIIKKADKKSLVTEFQTLLPWSTVFDDGETGLEDGLLVECLPPMAAAAHFVKRYRECKEGHYFGSLR